jgi:O-antigen/teichoic acid export membrane protein
MAGPPGSQPNSGHSTGSHHEEMRRSVRETAVYVVSKILPAIATLLSVKVFTGWYGPEGYGQYATIFALAMMVTGLFMEWLQIALLRLYPRYGDRDQRREIVSAAWVLYLISLLVSLLICFGLQLFEETAWGRELRFEWAGWVFVLFAANSFLVLTSTFLRAERKAGLYTLIQSLASFFKFLFGAGLSLLAGVAVSSLVWGASLAMGVAGALAFSGGKKGREGRAGLRLPGLESIGDVVRFGLPLALGQFASQILFVSDRYMIAVMAGDKQAGLYSVSYDLADLAVRLVLLTFMLSAYTAVMECYEKKGKIEAERLNTSLTRVYLLAACPAAVGCGLVQHDAIRVFAAPQFWEGAGLMVWIALADLCLGLSQYQNFGLHVAGKTFRISVLTVIAALLNVALNLVFIPRYGYWAAGYSTFVSFALLAVATPFLSRPFLAWRVPWVSLARIGCGLVVMVIGAVAVSGLVEGALLRLILKVGVGALSYGACLVVTGEVPYRRLIGMIRGDSGSLD